MSFAFFHSSVLSECDRQKMLSFDQIAEYLNSVLISTVFYSHIGLYLVL